jgi:flagellar biosynthesis protein FlhG
MSQVIELRKPSQHPVRVISVTSGKGGVGKTNIVANLALALTLMGKTVLVMDADLGLANVDVLLGLNPQYNVHHVFSGEKNLSEVIIKGPGGFWVMPASSGVQELTALSKEQKLILLSELDSLDQRIDFLLIDTGAGISSNVIYFNIAAQEKIVVVTPEPTSLTDAYATIKVLARRYQERHFEILINSASDEKEAKAIYRKLGIAADRFLGSLSLDYLGFIPYDENIPMAVARQKAVIEAYPGSPSSRTFVGLARNISEMPMPTRMCGNISFFWHRLLTLQNSGEDSYEILDG